MKFKLFEIIINSIYYNNMRIKIIKYNLIIVFLTYKINFRIKNYKIMMEIIKIIHQKIRFKNIQIKIQIELFKNKIFRIKIIICKIHEMNKNKIYQKLLKSKIKLKIENCNIMI